MEMLAECQGPQPHPVQVNLDTTSSQVGGADELISYPSPAHGTRSGHHQLLKRGRHLADIDGEGSKSIKKKRRLRRILITSRLSKPYAAPPTHISGRRTMGAGIWSRQRVEGRNLYRRAAVLNSAKKNRMAAKANEQRRSGFAEMTPIYDDAYLSSLDSMDDDDDGTQKSSTKSIGSSGEYYPPFQSLDLPSYDLEDDDKSTDGEEEDESEGDNIYSDFSALNLDSASYDDGDFPYTFGSGEIEQTLVHNSSAKTFGLILEHEKHEEVSIAPCTPCMPCMP